jgi:hypothetical protein
VLDQYDPTVSEYSDRSMSRFTFGGDGAWTSSECSDRYAWGIFYNNQSNDSDKGATGLFGVCPVICIPLS